MPNYLNAEEKRMVEEFRKSIEEMRLGITRYKEDPMRDAVRSKDGRPSPLELVIQKMEKEDPYL